MTGQIKEFGTFVHGVAARGGRGFFVLIDDEMSAERIRHSILADLSDGKFSVIENTGWHSAGLALLTDPHEQAVAVGEGGMAVVFSADGSATEENIAPTDLGPRNRGPIRGVRAVDGRIYAVGMDRQVYVRVGASDWRPLQAGLSGTPRGTTSGFESTDGYAQSELYAVGWDGEIWEFNGIGWVQRASPTNLVLTGVCCGEDGIVYACGRRGLLISGRHATWSVIDQSEITDDIWGLAWFAGRLFLSTFAGVYSMQDGLIELVDMGADQPETYYELTVSSGELWSIGAKDVMRFDGTTWSRVD